MEDMGAILVYVNALHIFRIHIPCNIGALINDQNLFPAACSRCAITAP
jgi:hypothetical protein